MYYWVTDPRATSDREKKERQIRERDDCASTHGCTQKVRRDKEIAAILLGERLNENMTSYQEALSFSFFFNEADVCNFSSDYTVHKEKGLTFISNRKQINVRKAYFARREKISGMRPACRWNHFILGFVGKVGRTTICLEFSRWENETRYYVHYVRIQLSSPSTDAAVAVKGLVEKEKEINAASSQVG